MKRGAGGRGAESEMCHDAEECQVCAGTPQPVTGSGYQGSRFRGALGRAMLIRPAGSNSEPLARMEV